jgi:hypothetical protein
MRVKTTNAALRALYDGDLMGVHYDPPGVRFHNTGTSQEISREVGERLVEHYGDIEPYE